MTKETILDWLHKEQEQIATAKDLNQDVDFDYEEALYKLERLVKELIK